MAALTDNETDTGHAADKFHALRRTVTGPVRPVTLMMSRQGYRLIGTKATVVVTSTG